MLPARHPERSSHFFASGVEGSTRSDFFFPARFQAHRFAAIPPRVRFGLRLAHLVGMTEKGAREKIDTPRGRLQRAGCEDFFSMLLEAHLDDFRWPNVAAVDHQGCATDPTRRLRGEKNARVGNIFNRAEPAKRT